jgi:glutamate synthase (NADPH/NADH) small chain
VLGGGNTAMDAASESARMGCPDVILAYRRSKNEMGAYHFEYELAKDAGVKGLFNAAPLEFIGNGKVTAVKFIKTKTENGKVVNITGSEFILECDMVIMATGQKSHDYLFDSISNFETNGTKVKVNNFQTSNPKYFAGGDCVNGGAEVVNGAYDGKHAAIAMLQFLKI